MDNLANAIVVIGSVEEAEVLEGEELSKIISKGTTTEESQRSDSNGAVR